MPYRRHRKDGNDEEVTTALLAYGWSVCDNSQSQEDGAPDKFIAKDGRTAAAEVKLPGESLRASQEEWRKKWKGEYVVLTCWEDVARLTADIP